MGGEMNMYSGFFTSSIPPAFQSALRPGFYWWYLRSVNPVFQLSSTLAEVANTSSPPVLLRKLRGCSCSQNADATTIFITILPDLKL